MAQVGILLNTKANKKRKKSQKKKNANNPTSGIYKYTHACLHKQLHTDEEAILDTVLQSKHMKWIFIRRVEPSRLQVSRLRLFMYGSLSYLQ